MMTNTQLVLAVDGRVYTPVETPVNRAAAPYREIYSSIDEVIYKGLLPLDRAVHENVYWRAPSHPGLWFFLGKVG